MKHTKPMSFIDEAYSSLKKFIDGDDKFVNEVKVEVGLLVKLCAKLNTDKNCIDALNSLLINPLSRHTTQEYFLSDLIEIYNQQIENETTKSRFVLSYYFDVIHNGHYTGNLNYNLNVVRERRSIVSVTKKPNQSFIITALSKTNNPLLKEALDRLNNFAKLAFNVHFDPQEIVQQIAVTSNKEATVITTAVDIIKEDDSLEKVLDELNQLIGLDKVKNDVKELINLLEIQKLRDAEGLKNVDVTLHNVFLGPPGTGKTTVARLLARIYKHLGFLSKGQLYETDREGLVAGFVGQTATKVDKVVTESIGGVLFIDEAYSLTQNLMGSDYGSEAINTLLKRMEDNRDDLSVVVAGYTEPMKAFVESNPGLRSRFNRYFYFDHFTPEQLFKVFEGFCKKSDFILDADAKEKLSDTFELLVEKRDDSFGNARVVRNIFEKCVQNQANRIIKLKKKTKKTLKTFTEADIPEPKDTVEHTMFTTDKEE
jgi:SpoVK/Ycf46/Vps4 family AAA+-type ATPase